MPQNELARPHFSRIPQIYQNSLRTWLDNGSVETFSEDELKLHRAAALAYADPRRPSIRSLHTMLCDMLTRDGSASGIPLQPPTLPSFRHLVLTLPDEFVIHMRYGRGVSLWDIVADAGQAIDDLAGSGTASVN
ncbi:MULTISPECIES: hypothetical protein [Agrobacterium tumefaciens complex]|uniref:hypothetical protein n=1 Tax=Agrobacterium tumefaciens complex TaxID=1183400 RepID=UPI0021CE0518|nr:MULTISPECIES: hypothetical protein [Agrobacterium tumefaciens complex]UXS24280.1 hypothetical protein FY153_07365 [Agrobacterium tumefaciens]UXS52446.1 hypothetical protein FY148_07170 [Agrobacterium tumefaciens]UXS62692.1 hypothetical protein FY147_07170 [Agrobacterium tumefaciens]